MHRQCLMLIATQGNFYWEPALQLVVFVPKGQRRESVSWPLTLKQNNFHDALKKALRMALRELATVRIETDGSDG